MVILDMFKLSRCVSKIRHWESFQRSPWSDPHGFVDPWKQWFMTLKKHEQTIVKGVDTLTYNPGAHIFSQMDGLQKYEKGYTMVYR